MAHHSGNPEGMNRVLGGMAESMGLGATKKFPEGKLTEDDEGEIQMAITALDGNVVLNFGTPTAWVGMLPEQAEALAESLRAKAADARASGGSGRV